MAKYEITRAWNGVEVGDIIELEKLHPSLKSSVRPVSDKVQLTPATPDAKASGEKDKKSDSTLDAPDDSPHKETKKK